MLCMSVALSNAIDIAHVWCSALNGHYFWTVAELARFFLDLSYGPGCCLVGVVGCSVAGGSSRTFLHDELLYKILLRLLRVG